MRSFLLCLFLLSGCITTLPHDNGSHIQFTEDAKDLNDLYLSENIKRLKILLRADVWLLDQHRKCDILTELEVRTLQERIALIECMIKIIKATGR